MMSYYPPCRVRWTNALVLAMFLATIAEGRAELVLPKIFGDHMVLQRGMAAPIWGKTAPGEKVSVRVDWRWRTMTTTADGDGKWMVKVPTPRPGGPHTITIQAGAEKVVLRDVLVGEVWVCSGQSNMEFPVAYKAEGYWGVTNWEGELQHADFPNIRLFTVQNGFALAPQFDCTGNWTNANAETVREFSAVGYFFGRELHEKLKVPVGLISADFGGTVCEAWTSADTLKQFPDFAEDLKAVETERDHPDELARLNAAKIAAWTNEIASQAAAMTNTAPELDDSDWNVATNLGAWTGDIQYYEGFITFRKTFTLPDAWTNRDLVLELGPVDDIDLTSLNGSRIGATIGESTWNVPRVYRVPAATVRPGTNVLVVSVLNTGGPGGIYGPVRLHPSDEGDAMSLDHDWRFQVGPKYSTLPQPVLRAGANSPSVLFNAMIAPLVPFGIRGAIWYQGESNIGRAKQYRRLFPAMIADWRSHWGEGDFPFYFTQIAPFRYPNPGMSSELREAQLLSMRVPNTGMAVTMDSDSNNLHPRNKQPVGHRLALWALAKTYGQKNIAFSGPIYKAMDIEADKIRLQFDHTDGGLVGAHEVLEHFTIAGADGKFVPAQAVIDGGSIVVSSNAVRQPVAVRYGWADTDESSFGNGAGLPAPSFRTDAPTH